MEAPQSTFDQARLEALSYISNKIIAGLNDHIQETNCPHCKAVVRGISERN